ncbi:hypothetical protein [Bacillus sp. PK3_68]|uniref:hypothetical protein n=1 Tax=Bacillus sp. PK3_68 TaxID=2027408 RepID=UPI000E736970|nr:hypothetical protein [Bacillus sp. PK3_68]RJS61822.1 hypothetical protein CJ483_18730 [Bacillus sp. PK3_68]
MKAKISLLNTVQNQEIARKIKQANQAANNTLDISFEKDLSKIFLKEISYLFLTSLGFLMTWL